LSTYDLDDLRQRGPRHALALLLQHVAAGEEPFATYGAVAGLLERKLGIPTIFPTHIGAVAGALMDLVLEEDPDAPLINALVTRPDGLPGRGFGGYYDTYRRPEGARSWKKLSRGRRIEEVEAIRGEVRRYADWSSLYESLFGSPPEPEPVRKKYTERDGKPPETDRPPGGGESQEHQRLKAWACENPAALGLSAGMKGEPEAGLLSGDRIDVLFSSGTHLVAVEVKSILSGEDDWQRGVYQCVKYRAVLEAQNRPGAPQVRALLLTEEKLPPHLRERASLFGVKLKVHRLNESPPKRASAGLPGAP
jgi:hypothetical protein